MKITKILRNILLVCLAGAVVGCKDPETEGKIIKKEIEPERRWIVQTTVAPIRVPPRETYHLLTDKKDFVLHSLRVDGRIDRFYVSEEVFINYGLGERVKYNPFLIDTQDSYDSEQLIDETTARKFEKQGITIFKQ